MTAKRLLDIGWPRVWAALAAAPAAVWVLEAFARPNQTISMITFVLGIVTVIYLLLTLVLVIVPGQSHSKMPRSPAAVMTQ